MVARPSIIFGDSTKNFLNGDLLAAALRFNRKVDVFVPPTARQNLFVCHPPRPSLFQSGVSVRSHLLHPSRIDSRWEKKPATNANSNGHKDPYRK
jgi:hypothetical protein